VKAKKQAPKAVNEFRSILIIFIFYGLNSLL